MGINRFHGSEASYGAFLYLRWETEDGVVVKLVESKASSLLLDQKVMSLSRAVRGCLCIPPEDILSRSTATSRSTRWIHLSIVRHTGSYPEDSLASRHFLQTGLEKSTRPDQWDSWRWVEGRQNVADLLTREASLRSLLKDQSGRKAQNF